MKVVLASNSPRRKELLTQANIEFVVDASDIEEKVTSDIPYEVVMELSIQKAQAVAQNHIGQIIVAADTVVSFDGKILGKPKDEKDAFEMLSLLSKNVHQVYTGVTIIDMEGHPHTFYECTDVKMYENSDEQIRAYIATKEPMDKAGAYGIQGLGAILVEKINGDYNNVVGLPLSALVRRLNELQN